MLPMSHAFLPTARQELLLKAALLSGEAALIAWRQVAGTLDLERLDGASRSLLPLVYGNLVRHDLRGQALDGLKEQYLLTWKENQGIWRAAAALLQAFEETGIDAIVLKGLALIACFYRDIGLRPMADVDVLVSASDVDLACDVARRLGWQPRYLLTPAFRRVKHAGPLDHPDGVACDVHWKVFEEAGAGAADDELRAAAGPIIFQGRRLRVFSPTDQLLHVCGHAARWEPVPAIRWVADAVLIVREAAIDWQRLVSQAARRRFILRIRQMLAYLREVFGVAIPQSVDADLRRRPVSMVERIEYRVRSREHRLLGELPTYVFNCLREEPRPLLAFPGYLRDAWGLESMAAVPGHALALAVRRVKTRS
jgi:putative nucleotidyltransferase-like protein